MSASGIRVGLVGAGANTKLRHIPGFRSISGVEIAGVANSNPASSAKVAAEYGIPQTYANWQELVADPGIDAICIGTWPNLHADVTCAALENGKHVLCEARMASDLAAAQRMWQASQKHPHLVAQIVPSPFGLESHDYVRELIHEQFVGDIREVVVIGADDAFWDFSKLLHWRQDRSKSGLNILTMGILHETASRWIPPTTRVFAQTQTFEPERPDPVTGQHVNVTVPDSLQIITQLANGGRALYHFSGVTLFGPGKQIHIYGSKGTIKLEFGAREKLLVGRIGGQALQEVEIPSEKRGGWRVEAEFIGAIRGEENVRLTDFAKGLQYMEFTEAVHLSAETGRAVELPLSNLA